MEPNADPILYTVKRGDTLSKIAVAHNVTTAQLAEWNQITDIDKIKVGQILIVGWVETEPEPEPEPDLGEIREAIDQLLVRVASVESAILVMEAEIADAVRAVENRLDLVNDELRAELTLLDIRVAALEQQPPPEPEPEPEPEPVVAGLYAPALAQARAYPAVFGDGFTVMTAGGVFPHS